MRRNWMQSGSATAPLLLLAVLVGPLGGCHIIWNGLGGAWQYEPHEMPGRLSPQAEALIDEAFADIEEDEAVIDMHTHMISHEVNPNWVSWLRPFRYGRTRVFLSGAGVAMRSPTLEQDYIDRMLAQVEHFPRQARLYLYAMDRSYFPDGTFDARYTSVYVSNHRVFELSQEYPDTFAPVVSLHPYREDAMAKLHYWADRGVRHVKWIPNSMGVNPATPRLDAFYDAMVERDMVLLSHTGDEDAVDEIDAELGNPLLLRRPLDRGVKVVALHFASNGWFMDLDHPRDLRQRPGYELLLRMLDDPAYEELLYIDTASMIFFNHLEEPLKAMLDRPDLHHRFINGSDYPLSALNITIWTSMLRMDGFIQPEHVRPLNEIYEYNPMLFEYVTKRMIRHPETGKRMGRQMFIGNEAIW